MYENRRKCAPAGFVVCLAVALSALLLSGISVLASGSPPVANDDPTALETANLIAATGRASDLMGSSVAMEGTTAVVGAVKGTAGTDSDAGAAYVFIYSGGTWSQQATLTAPGYANNELFGSAVAISGDRIVVGAEEARVSGIARVGRAHVFSRSGSTWTHEATLTAPGWEQNDYFGNAVAISGEKVLVGARAAGPGNNQDGAVHAYSWTGSAWSHDETLTHPAPASGDWFGVSVSVDGTTCVIGYLMGGLGGEAGVFGYDAGWSREATLSSSIAIGTFGWATAISGDTCVVGSDGQVSEVVEVFVRDGSSWSREATLTPFAGTGDCFGQALALDGDICVVGAERDDTIDTDSGAVYTFMRSGGMWSDGELITASDGEGDDEFGTSVALSDGIAVIGCPNDRVLGNNQRGSAYVYEGMQLAYRVAEDGSLSIPAEGVLSNDTDAESDPLTASVSTSTAHGTLTLDSDGSFDYTPDADFFGEDAFTYRAHDGAGYSNPATATITVTPMPDAPVASDDPTTTLEDTLIDVDVPGVLGNDTDADGDSLEASLTAGPAHAQSFHFSKNGKWDYVPEDDWHGVDVFTYVARDDDGKPGTLYSQTAVVTITVTSVEDVPVAANDATTIAEDTTVSVAAPGVLSNDTDGDGDSLTAVLVGEPANGSLSLASDGSFEYRPDEDFTGEDFFTYRASDGDDLSNSAAVSITVTGVNDLPVGRDDGAIREVAKLLASNGAPYDWFGDSAAADGDTVVIGATSADGPVGANTGAAYVYVRAGNAWSQQATLTASDGAAGDRFGSSVGVSGDTVVVGAAYEDPSGKTDCGSAYVFSRSGSVWSQQQKLNHGSGVANDCFGESVAVDADTAVIGAYGQEEGSYANAGAAYVFTRSGGAWTERTRLTDGAAAGAGNWFGYAVDLSGGLCAIGSPRADTLGGADAGSASVFSGSGGSWTKAGQLEAADAAAGDRFGSAVSLDGTTCVVGAYAADGESPDSGAVYVFGRPASDWTQQQKLTPSGVAAYDRFGWSIGLDGNVCVIGAAGDDGVGADSGTAYLFSRSGNTWTEVKALEGLARQPGDASGDSVAISGNTCVLGARYDDDKGTDSGSASIVEGVAYVVGNSNVLSIAAPGVLANDRDPDLDELSTSLTAEPGHGDLTLTAAGSLQFTPDGDWYGEDTFSYVAFDGTGYSSSTVVTITVTPDPPVARTDPVPGQVAKLLPEGDCAWDRLGESVALAGTTCVVGVPGYDGLAVDSGAVYVFGLTGTTWSLEDTFAGEQVEGHRFGSSVAVSGTTCVVAALGAETDGAAYVFTRSGQTWSQEATLSAGDACAVAIDGTTCAVGAMGSDDPNGPDSGVVRVFTRTGSTWTREATLTAADGAAGDGFGSSLAVDRDTCLVGVPADDTTQGADAGSAYAFKRSGVAWTQEASFTGVGGAAGDRFGTAVDVHGDRCVVGAPYNDSGATDAGAVFFLSRSGSTWTHKYQQYPSFQTQLHCGSSVAMEGDYCVAGFPDRDWDGDTDPGTAQVWKWVSAISNWNYQATILPDGGEDGPNGEHMGASVALSGDRAVFGAPGDSFNGPESGSVYVRNAGNWSVDEATLMEETRAGEFTCSGPQAVGFDGDTVVVGAKYDDVGSRYRQGSAYVFTRSAGGFVQQTRLVASDGAGLDYFGTAAALSGDSCLVGAPYDDIYDGGWQANAGSAYMFTRSGGSWDEGVRLASSSTTDYARLGESVALDDEAGIALAGASRMDSLDASGEVVPESGVAFAFERSGGQWTQSATLAASDATRAAGFGFSVALDGTTCVVGAYDWLYTRMSSAYVFTRSEDASWTQVATLTPTGGTPHDGFGRTTALSGDTCLVGAPFADYAGPYSGSVFVFRRVGATWTAEATLSASDGGAGQKFGSSLALDGDRALIGAPQASDGSEEESAGAVYVFTRQGSTWTEQRKLTGGDSVSGDSIGSAVALWEDQCVFGAPGDDDAGWQSGQAFLFGELDETYRISEDTTLYESPPGLLRNDVDNEADPLTAHVAAAPGHGALALATDGSFTYRPDDDFAGEDTFSYRAHDGSSYSSAVVVTITVTPAPDPPTAVDDSATVTEDGTLTVGAGAGVLINDSDPDGDSISASLTVEPVNGSVGLGADGGYEYVPEPDFSGEDSFSYAASDGTGVSGPAVVTIEVTPVEDAPVAVDDPVLAQIASLLASEPASLDSFGFAVDIDGDSAVVGAPGDGGDGAAYVFARNGWAWDLQARLRHPDGEPGDRFGCAVAIDDTAVVVGMESDDWPGIGADTGLAVAFGWDGADWVLTEYLWAYDHEIGDEFGRSVAVDGDTIVVGSHGDCDNGTDSGSAYVYTRSGSDWVHEAKLLADDGVGLDRFGGSVGVDGDTIVVGAWGDDDHGSESGSAYVFARPGGFWAQQTKLTAAGGQAGDLLGSSAALFGDTCVIGMPEDDNSNGSTAGAVCVFARSGATWSQQATLVASDGSAEDRFGSSVALQGGVCVAGAPGHDGAGTDAGSAYVFERSGSAWTQRGGFIPAAAAADDLFGCSVALSNGTCVAGSVGDGSLAGSTHLFGQVGVGYTTRSDRSLSVTMTGVLSNDRDAEGRSLEASLVAGPAHGSLALNGDGSFDYTPGVGFVGADTFRYRAWDGILYSNTANVTITVTSASTDGAIEGAVSDGATPLAGISVDAWRWSGSAWAWEKLVISKGDGTYRLEGLPSGDYRLRYSDKLNRFQLEYYEDAGSLGAATTIQVGAGETVADVDAVLTGVGKISGVVRNASGTGIQDITVDAWRWSGTSWVWQRLHGTRPDGSYTIGYLPAGTYRIRFADKLGRYTASYFDGATSIGTATDIVVTPGGEVSGTDVTLAGVGRISGTVRNVPGDPLANIMVDAWRWSGSSWVWQRCMGTKADGTYSLGGLSEGTYRIRFSDKTYTYKAEYYDDKTSLPTATDIVLSAGTHASGTDAVLGPGP